MEVNQRISKRPKLKQGSGFEERLNHTDFFFVLLILALLFPYQVEYKWWFFSTISVLDGTLLLLFFIVSFRIVARKRLDVGDSKIFIVLLMPFLFSILSLLWSVNVTVTIKSIVVYGTAVATFLITVNLARRHSLSQLALLVVVCTYLLVLTSVLSYIPGSPLRPETVIPVAQLGKPGFLLSYTARLSHPFIGLSNSFATILAMLLPITLFIYQSGIRRHSALWATALLFAAIIATLSRGVILAVLCVLMVQFVVGFLKSGRIRTSLLASVPVCSAMILSFFVVIPNANERLIDRLNLKNISARLDTYHSALSVVKQTPCGIGSGVWLSDVSTLTWRSVHNAYLQNLLWYGWFGGLFLCLLLLILPVLVLLRPVRSRLGRQAKRAVSMSIAILLLINLSQASWEGSVLRVWIYFVIGLGVVMIRKSDSLGSDYEVASNA